MKKYISSASSEELQRKLSKKLEEERAADLVIPVIRRVLDKFSYETGFNARVRKYYYREDLNAVLLDIEQYYNSGFTSLVAYSNPGRAKPSHPAMISLDASDNEVYNYVGRLVDKLITRIQETFDSWTTIIKFDGEDESMFDSKAVTASIVKSAYCDEARASNFIRSLLNSGEVVNKLWDYVAEDDKGYYLVDKRGNEIHMGTLYYERRNM